MMHAYPQMKGFAFWNVQKCYVVIIDNTCDLKIPFVSLYLLPFLRLSLNLCVLEFPNFFEIFEMFKNVMLWSLKKNVIQHFVQLALFLTISEISVFWNLLKIWPSLTSQSDMNIRTRSSEHRDHPYTDIKRLAKSPVILRISVWVIVFTSHLQT